MRVLLVTHYYPPEIGAPQARLSEMAKRWTTSGIVVTVLTGMPNHPTGEIPEEYKGAIIRSEKRDGVRVLRNWVYATPNEGFVKKTLGHLTFMVTAVLLGAPRAGPADIVVVSSPTFFSIASAWVIARLRRARLVVEVRDLWPAIFVELGVLKNRRLIAFLGRLELAAYRAADAVVVVTEGFREDLLSRGVPAEKVHTIRNGVDLERFNPDLSSDPADRRWLGANEGDTLVLYLGAHGISQGLSAVIDAAKSLEGQAVHVALVGEGADKQNVAERLRIREATNVTMQAGVPRDRVPPLVAAADVCLVPLRDLPLFNTFIPSKMFEYLGAGKPVVGSVRGEAADILKEAGAVVVAPEDPVALTAAIRALAADPELRQRMGRAGHDYVRRHFDRRVLADRYVGVFRQVVGGRGAK